jgi:hypothetical protein
LPSLFHQIGVFGREEGQRGREIGVIWWMFVLSLSDELYSSTDLGAKKALLEIRKEINYN